MLLLGSAGGNRVPGIAQLVQADEDTVRDVIHRFNEIGLPGPSANGVGRAGVHPYRPTRRRADLLILDILSAHQGAGIRRCAKKNKVELCCTPTYASWANPIEARFGPLRQFTIANSNHLNHPVQTRSLHAYLRWRKANARHRDVLAAERKERARIRSERGVRRGGRALKAAARPNPANLRGHSTGSARRWW